jgi:Rho-binding antiterminator
MLILRNAIVTLIEHCKESCIVRFLQVGEDITMNMEVISCELHDFVEVACMYGYRLKLTLKNQQIVEGKAMDIVNSPEKRECLVIDQNGDDKQHIDLTELVKMEVLTPNARFKEVVFG